MRQREEGSITVFLTLIFLVLIALGCGMIELARGSAAQNQAQRLLRIGTESLMAEYSEPLYREYHLFFLEDAGTSYEDTIQSYINKNLEKKESLFSVTDLFDGTLEEVSVTDKTYVTEDGGQAMLNQICEYMKRESVSQLFENVKAKKGALDSMQEESAELEKTAAEQKEEAKDGRNLIEWMKKVDGVCVQNGKMDSNNVFAKMFFHGEKKPQTFHITDSKVWKKMQHKVISVEEMLKQMSKSKTDRKRFVNIFHKLSALCEKMAEEADQNPTLCSSVTGGTSLVAELRNNQSIIGQSLSLLSGKWTEQTKEKMRMVWKGYKMPSICFDYEGAGEEGGRESPLESFSSALSGGILKMVMKDYDKLSNQAVKNSDHYLSLFREQEKLAKKDPVKTLTEDEEVDFQNSTRKIGDCAVTEACLLAYLHKFFSNGTEKMKTGNVLRYEWEYLIAAGKSDKQNLSDVVERIVLLRTAANTSALFASVKSRETAHAAALAVVGFTAIEPLIRFMQTLFTVLWGMAEAIVDTAALMQGKHVPLVKTADRFCVKFPELFGFTHDLVMKKVLQYKQAGKTSFGYEEYLCFFLLGMDRSTICLRMLDLMEWKIQKKYVPKFRMGLCTSQFEVKAKFCYPWKLPFHLTAETNFETEAEQLAVY